MIGFILILIAAFFFPGIILRTKSILSGRKGPGYLSARKRYQGVVDERKRFQQNHRYDLSDSACHYAGKYFMRHAADSFCRDRRPFISFEGDFVFFSYLLAFGKFFAIIAALDTGSSFEGMGANREALFSMLVEPAFFILLATFAMFTGYTSFSDIFSNFFISGKSLCNDLQPDRILSVCSDRHDRKQQAPG